MQMCPTLIHFPRRFEFYDDEIRYRNGFYFLEWKQISAVCNLTEKKKILRKIYLVLI